MSVTSMTITVNNPLAQTVRAEIEKILAAHELPHAMSVVEIPTDDEVLSLARTMLAALDANPGAVARMVFHAEEWDNGWFFTNYPTVTYAIPEDDLDFDLGDGRFEDLAYALYEMRGETLGPDDAAVIDLVAGTVDLDAVNP